MEHPDFPNLPSSTKPGVNAARVEVVTETPEPRGWSYSIRVHRESGVCEHTVTLAWCDHDHWSGGRLAPSRVVQAAVEYSLSHGGPTLPARFDAARIRRYLPQMDDDLRATL